MPRPTKSELARRAVSTVFWVYSVARIEACSVDQISNQPVRTHGQHSLVAYSGELRTLDK